jgi:hypothetical protein
MRKILTIIAAAPLGLGVAVGAPAPASAGSDNGTNNWYSSTSCSTSGGRLDITNYDIKGIDGSVWQQYHIDADRAGGVGDAPRVYTRPNYNYNWVNMTRWNDFYMAQADQWQYNDFKVEFANGTDCARRL